MSFKCLLGETDTDLEVQSKGKEDLDPRKKGS